MPLLKLNATTSQRRWFSILQFMASIVKQNIVAMICQQSGLLWDEPRKSTSFQNLLSISFVKKIKSSIYFNVRFKGFVLLSFAKPTQLSFPPIAKQLTLKAPFVHKKRSYHIPYSHIPRHLNFFLSCWEIFHRHLALCQQPFYPLAVLPEYIQVQTTSYPVPIKVNRAPP